MFSEFVFASVPCVSLREWQFYMLWDVDVGLQTVLRFRLHKR